MDLWIIFLTGLSIGGISCMAVQGSLLASTISSENKQKDSKVVLSKKDHALPVASFLAAKLIAYSVLGFLLGAFGSAVSISDSAIVTLQIAAGIYMVLIALNLLNVHPIFRYVVIQPPKFLSSFIRKQSKRQDLFAPAFLGLLTVFIPCGTTLAMEALAITSGSPFLGAATMAVFTIGTMPLFFGLGYLTSALSSGLREKFIKFAGIAVMYLGVSSINGSLLALDSPLSIQSIVSNIPITVDLDRGGDAGDRPNNTAVNQNAVINIVSGGYSPNYLKVKKDQPVTLTLVSKDTYSCALAFRIPSLGISKNLKANDTQTITFTPTQTGKIQFNCSMGMYRGVIEVI